MDELKILQVKKRFTFTIEDSEGCIYGLFETQEEANEVLGTIQAEVDAEPMDWEEIIIEGLF